MCSVPVFDFEKFVALVQKYPVLYNKATTGYKNVMLKTKIWNTIASEMGISGEECMKKWKTLRDRFTRELKKMEGFGTGTESQQYESPHWDLFENLLFLTDSVMPRKTVSNFTIENDDDNVNTETSISLSPIGSPSEFGESCTPTREKCPSSETPRESKQSKKKQKTLNEINSAFIETANFMKSALEKRNQPTTGSTNEKFGQAIATLIDNLPQNVQPNVRASILQYISEVTNEQLTQ